MRMTQTINLFNIKKFPDKMERITFFTHLSEKDVDVVKTLRRQRKKVEKPIT
jgi:hypothetical protein